MALFGRKNAANVDGTHATTTGNYPAGATTTTGARRSGGIGSDFQVAFLEFCGTFLFLLVGLGAIQAAAWSSREALSQSNTYTSRGDALHVVANVDQLLYVSVAMGLSLLFTSWLFFRVTGGIFNPNVSTALLLIGAIGPVRWVLCCIAQIVGAIAASGVLLALLPGHLASNTTQGLGVNKAQAVFIEMFLTGALVLAVLMFAAEKHRASPFAPIAIGLTYFACHLWGYFFTGASMNTARSFGPAVVSGFKGNHWIYWVGPFAGTLLGTGLYHIFKRLPFWSSNANYDNGGLLPMSAGPFDTHYGGNANAGTTGRRSSATAAYNPAIDPPTGAGDHEKGAMPGQVVTGQPGVATAPVGTAAPLGPGHVHNRVI